MIALRNHALFPVLVKGYNTTRKRLTFHHTHTYGCKIETHHFRYGYQFLFARPITNSIMYNNQTK